MIDAAKAMRLFHEHPEVTLRELTLPFLDARKRVARYPQGEHRVRLVAVPTTSGTGSEVSPAAVITAGDRKVTLVDYSLVPDMAVVDPTLTLSMPPELTADTGDRRAHPRAGGLRLDLRLALHRRVLPAGHPPDPRRAAARRRRRQRPARPHRHGQRRHDRRARVLQRLPRRQPRARPRRRRALRRRPRPRQRRLPPPRPALQRRASRPSSCPRPATRPTSRRRSTRRSPGCSASAAAARTPPASGCSRASTSCCARSASRARCSELGIAPGPGPAALPGLCRAAFADPSGRTNPRMPMLAELTELLEAGYRR